MERINERLEIAAKSLIAFDEALKMPVGNKIIRDAAIQRFEFTFEAIWKLTQLYLRQYEGVELGSPKTVFRQCLKSSLFDENQTVLALEMTNDRNLTVHTYNEELAEAIFSRLPKYYDLMEILNKGIRKNISKMSKIQ